jgi:PKD repeat protein
VLTTTAASYTGLTYSFNASGSTDSNSGDTITSYTFAYGDGNTTTGNTTGIATHTYGKPGTYTVTVTVTDSAGNTANTTTTVTTNGTDYTPDGPTRILDTRSGLGASKAKVGNGGTVALQVTGVDSVPADATAVVLNVTVTDVVTGGNLSAYPDGTTEPSTSTQNFAAGGTVPDLVTVKLGTDGKVALTVNGTSTTSVDIVADLEGYYTPTETNGYTEIQPGRILDTRSGLGATKAKVSVGQTLKLAVDGATATTNTATSGNITEALPASGITAVALNITVTNTVESGVVTAYADGTTLPTASNVNYTAGQTTANAAVVPVGSDGKIDLSVTGNGGTSTDIIADVEGYYTAGNGTGTSVFVPTIPARIYDTRQHTNGAILAGGYLHVAFSPTTPDAYALNITDVSPTGGGNLEAFPDNTQDNITSTLNFVAGQLVGNYDQATVSSTGIDIQNNSGGSVQIVVDEYGYFAAS